MSSPCDGCVYYYARNKPWTCELGKKPATCGSARLEEPQPEKEPQCPTESNSPKTSA
jgi:hypothetical protein